MKSHVRRQFSRSFIRAAGTCCIAAGTCCSPEYSASLPLWQLYSLLSIAVREPLIYQSFAEFCMRFANFAAVSGGAMGTREGTMARPSGDIMREYGKGPHPPLCSGYEVLSRMYRDASLSCEHFRDSPLTRLRPIMGSAALESDDPIALHGRVSGVPLDEEAV